MDWNCRRHETAPLRLASGHRSRHHGIARGSGTSDPGCRAHHGADPGHAAGRAGGRCVSGRANRAKFNGRAGCANRAIFDDDHGNRGDDFERCAGAEERRAPGEEERRAQAAAATSSSWRRPALSRVDQTVRPLQVMRADSRPLRGCDLGRRKQRRSCSGEHQRAERVRDDSLALVATSWFLPVTGKVPFAVGAVSIRLGPDIPERHESTKETETRCNFNREQSGKSPG